MIFFVFGLNFLANKLYWYSAMPWFDMLMHFLGGLWLGLAWVWFLSSQSLRLSPEPKALALTAKSILQIILLVLLVGILWEVFEFFVDETIAKNGFDLADTLSDLLFDSLGGFSAIFYLSKRIVLKPEDAVQLR